MERCGTLGRIGVSEVLVLVRSLRAAKKDLAQVESKIKSELRNYDLI